MALCIKGLTWIKSKALWLLILYEAFFQENENLTMSKTLYLCTYWQDVQLNWFFLKKAWRLHAQKATTWIQNMVSWL
jgi:hypothetical protein